MSQEQEFTVRDRRSASPDAGPAQPQRQGEENAGRQQPSARADAAQDAGTPPDLDFSSFIISLAGTAQMSLGLLPHPETKRTVQNIPAAKQLIDILGMLQGKTKGNLNRDEETLLEQVLFNLRMHYVRVAEEEKKSGGS